MELEATERRERVRIVKNVARTPPQHLTGHRNGPQMAGNVGVRTTARSPCRNTQSRAGSGTPVKAPMVNLRSGSPGETFVDIGSQVMKATCFASSGDEADE